MYRVELKVRLSTLWIWYFRVVPNVPCGVESIEAILDLKLGINVPNVPCGVESRTHTITWKSTIFLFLMYRVELKVQQPCTLAGKRAMFLMYRVELKVLGSFMAQVMGRVPNVPCGVERLASCPSLTSFLSWFLMYRVELKA